MRKFGTWVLLGAELGTRGSCAAELAEESILLLPMSVGVVAVDRIRRNDAGLQASQRAVGEGDAGRDGAYDEAGGVALLKRSGLSRRERAQHQPRHYNTPFRPAALHC